jgi:hypothetical protein
MEEEDENNDEREETRHANDGRKRRPKSTSNDTKEKGAKRAKRDGNDTKEMNEGHDATSKMNRGAKKVDSKANEPISKAGRNDDKRKEVKLETEDTASEPKFKKGEMLAAFLNGKVLKVRVEKVLEKSNVPVTPPSFFSPLF